MNNKIIYTIGLIIVGLIIIARISSMQKSSLFDNFLNDYKKENSLNGVILIAKDQSIMYHRPFGWANKENNCENTINTIFLIGSLTKTFTATAILLLAQQGLLNLDAPISTYLTKENPIWANKMPEWANQVTIHQLLTHSSGLSEYVTLSGFDEFYEKPHSSTELIQFFAQEPLKFMPGSQYSYSGSGYNVLGAVIEAISSQPYNSFLKNNFFLPLDIYNIDAPHNQMLSAIQKNNPDIAIGYTLLDKSMVPAGDVNLSTAFAEASIVSTAHDLYAWLCALFSNKILYPETISQMTKSYFITNQGEGIGYGITIDKSLGYETFTHSGRINGYDSIFLYEPTKKITTIILSNLMKSNIYTLAYDLMDLTYRQ